MTATFPPDTKIHPRLERRGAALAQLLKLGDPEELSAALRDIQTLLARCGYHVDFARDDRVLHINKRRGSRLIVGTPARRGRPPGTANWANRQLGLGLATIWFEQMGKKPTRRVDSYGDGTEHGPYREFVALVIAALPKRLLATRKGHVPEVDHLVRVSIDEFKAARGSSDEARRRGLIEEPRWLGTEPSAIEPDAN